MAKRFSRLAATNCRNNTRFAMLAKIFSPFDGRKAIPMAINGNYRQLDFLWRARLSKGIELATVAN